MSATASSPSTPRMWVNSVCCVNTDAVALAVEQRGAPGPSASLESTLYWSTLCYYTFKEGGELPGWRKGEGGSWGKGGVGWWCWEGGGGAHATHNRNWVVITLTCMRCQITAAALCSSRSSLTVCGHCRLQPGPLIISSPSIWCLFYFFVFSFFIIPPTGLWFPAHGDIDCICFLVLFSSKGVFVMRIKKINAHNSLWFSRISYDLNT